MNKDANKGKKKGGWGSVTGGMYSAYAHTKTGSKNTQQALKIQLTDQKITARKQKFGVDYMDLVEQNASEEALTNCLEAALEEIARLRGKLSKYEGTIAHNKQKLETKIAKRKGEPLPHTQPSIEVNDKDDNDNVSESASASVSSISTPAITPAPSLFPEAASASISASADASASSNNINSNPFDDDDEKPLASSSIKTDDATVPVAEAVPVSETNNPFDDDDDKKAGASTPTETSNPFDDNDDDNDEKPAASNSTSANHVNPFDEEEEDDKEEAAAAGSNSTKNVNPFDDDDEEEEKPSRHPSR